MLSLEELQELGREDWDNVACSGYALRAMKDLGISKELTDRIMNRIDYTFGEMSVEGAGKDFKVIQITHVNHRSYRWDLAILYETIPTKPIQSN